MKKVKNTFRFKPWHFVIGMGLFYLVTMISWYYDSAIEDVADTDEYISSFII